MDSSQVEEISARVEFLQKNPEVCVRLSEAAKLKSLSFSVDNFESSVLGVFNER